MERIDGLVVHLQNDIAHTIQEVSVVSHHEKRHAGTPQIPLQPLNHGEVKVVGGLIENEEIWFGNEYVGQSHTLELPT